MEIIILSALSVFAVLGICCFIKERIRHYFAPEPHVVFYEYNDENDAEYDLRCIQMKYPDCKIFIIDRGKNHEFIKILSSGVKNAEIIK